MIKPIIRVDLNVSGLSASVAMLDDYYVCNTNHKVDKLIDDLKCCCRDLPGGTPVTEGEIVREALLIGLRAMADEVAGWKGPDTNG